MRNIRLNTVEHRKLPLADFKILLQYNKYTKSFFKKIIYSIKHNQEFCNDLDHQQNKAIHNLVTQHFNMT